MIFLAFLLNLCWSLSDKNCMVPENIHTYPKEGLLEIPRGRGNQKSNQKSPHGRGMDFFWNNKLYLAIYSKYNKV